MAKRATKTGGKKGAPGKKGAGAKKRAVAKPAAGKKAAAKKAAPAGKKAARKKATPAAKKAAPAAKKAAPARRKAALKGVAKKAAPVLKGVAKKAAPILKKAPSKAKAVKAKAVKALKPAPAYDPAATQEDFEIIEEQPEEKKPGRAKRAATGVLNAALKVALAPVKAVAAAVSGGSKDDAGNAAELVTRLEEAYGVTLPERYRRFLSEGEHERYRRIELSGYIRGPYDLDFTDRLLTDVTELGENAGIHDMGDVPWNDDYAGYVPLASMSHPDLDEPKLFLVHDVARPAHRVLLFDYDGWRLYPLADSFDAFLANLPKATNDISTAFRPGPMS